MLPFSDAATNNSSPDVNDSNNKKSEYSLNVDNQTFLDDHVLNVSADQTVKFRIWDNTTQKFTTEGTIEIGKETLEIKSSSILDKAADIINEKTFGGTVGDNSEYYIEYSFKENSEATSYSLEVNVYNSIPTAGKLTINVKSNYITASKIVTTNTTYESISMKDLAGRNLKYRKDNVKNADDLINKTNDFLAVSNGLYIKINNLTNLSDKIQLESLSVENFLSSKSELEKSIKILQDKSKNDPLIKKQLTDQLNFISTDLSNITEELAKNLNEKNKILLKNELENAQVLEKIKTNELSSDKSNFRNEVFYPAGLLVILGFIIGYFNVNRWKKESEYFGLYTSKANVMSPIMLALILSIIIIILVVSVVYFEDGLGMFKFLI